MTLNFTADIVFYRGAFRLDDCLWGEGGGGLRVNQPVFYGGWISNAPILVYNLIVVIRI